MDFKKIYFAVSARCRSTLSPVARFLSTALASLLYASFRPRLAADALALVATPFTSIRLGRGLSPQATEHGPAHTKTARAVGSHVGENTIHAKMHDMGREHLTVRGLDRLASCPLFQVPGGMRLPSTGIMTPETCPPALWCPEIAIPTHLFVGVTETTNRKCSVQSLVSVPPSDRKKSLHGLQRLMAPGGNALSSSAVTGHLK